MLRVTLPFRRVSQQPLTTLASTATVLLSLSMTLAGACQQWPTHIPFATGLAITWELCKLELQCKGLEILRTAVTWRQILGAATCLAAATLFVAGSVGASGLCMGHAEGGEQARTLHSSRAYASATGALHNLDAQIATLHQAADSDIAGGYRKRGLATLDRLEGLRHERKLLEAQVLRLEESPITANGTTVPQALALVGISASPALIEFALEMLVGLVIELAGFIFLCCGYARTGPSTLPPPTLPSGPTPSKRSPQAHRQGPSRITLPSPAAVSTPAPIPGTYAKWLRFDFGAPLENAIKALEGSRCQGACRDLLHRMGQHCLRVGWTNGNIDAAVVFKELRGGRDRRTIEGYLARLVEVGALTLDGTTFTIQHFLAANPSVQRREARLADARSKNCKRQDKHRKSLQTLPPQPPQEADLTPSCARRNAEKPQPTSHAVSAAYAATHQPTASPQPSSAHASVMQASGTRRTYGAVATMSPEEEEDYQAWLQRVSDMAAGEMTSPLPLGDDTMTADLGDLSQHGETGAQGELDAAKRQTAAPAYAGGAAGPCIPAHIPSDPTPVNQSAVSKACERVGVPQFGRQAEDLFRRLAQWEVREPELAYAAFCTAKRKKEGKVRSPVGHLLAVIRRQRVAAATA